MRSSAMSSGNTARPQTTGNIGTGGLMGDRNEFDYGNTRRFHQRPSDEKEKLSPTVYSPSSKQENMNTVKMVEPSKDDIDLKNNKGNVPEITF